MSIIGCDLHTRYQIIAMLEVEAGEIVTRRLEHENGAARALSVASPADRLSTALRFHLPPRIRRLPTPASRH
jgi:hypothetical protein